MTLCAAAGRPASSSARLTLCAIADDESTRTPSRSKRTAERLITHHEDRPGREQHDTEHLRPGDRLLVEAEHPDAVEHDRQRELAGDHGGGYAAGAELADGHER